MKIQIAILSVSSWNFKDDKTGIERSGNTATFLLDDFSQSKITLSDEQLKEINKIKLPALFEANVIYQHKYQKYKFDNSPQNLVAIRELKIF